MAIYFGRTLYIVSSSQTLVGRLEGILVTTPVRILVETRVGLQVSSRIQRSLKWGKTIASYCFLIIVKLVTVSSHVN